MNDRRSDDSNSEAAEADLVEDENRELDELTEASTPLEPDEVNEADWLEQHQEVVDADDDYPPPTD